MPTNDHLYTILIVDDDQSVLELLHRLLSNQNFAIKTETEGPKALEHIGGGGIDLLIVDYNMPTMDGLTLLKKARSLAPRLQNKMLSGVGGVPEAVQAMKLGAIDFIEKKSSWKELQDRINKLHENWLLADEKVTSSRDESGSYHFDQMIGESEVINLLKKRIIKVAHTDTTVLIQGENGTGKELVARAIHHHSRRSTQPFVPVDCASMSETVMESELFGHKKGAYTGADTETIGLIRSAHNGVLFMDEIGELSLNAQAKLLRTLQERKVRPVGSATDYEIDIQVVAATNRNLSDEVNSGNFRQDLYYRLNAVSLEVPSLRERRDDIELLANHFLGSLSQPEQKEISISDDVMELLKQHDWPGNVRELQNVINRALVFAENSVLTPGDLPNNFKQNLPEGALESPAGSLADYEKSAIKQALIDAGNNRRRAAEILNIAEATLYRKIKKYGL